MADKQNILDGLTAAKVAKMSPEDQSKVKNSLLGKAATTLKERHSEEFEAIATALFSELGLERVRRLTQEEKDRQEFERLAAKLGVPLESAVAEGDGEA